MPNMSPATVLNGYYDYRLVALSVLIAMLASYAALDLAGRVTAARGGVRFIWLTSGAAAMGLGIWAMHYVGMLAYILPVPVLYDWPTVLVSLLAAVFASAVALFVVSRDKMGLAGAGIGGVLMGSGIAAMHYIGMDAMRLPAMCHYSPGLLSLSVVLAMVISLVALWLTFHLRDERAAVGWRKPASALLMGAAIPVMHYTGMAAVTFTAMTSVAAEGYQVMGAESGEKGLQRAKEFRPDAITLDVAMPHMDGWSVLTALKADPELNGIPVIMVTIVDDKNMGYALGAAEYLTKPVNRERLITVLRRFAPLRGRPNMPPVDADPPHAILSIAS